MNRHSFVDARVPKPPRGGTGRRLLTIATAVVLAGCWGLRSGAAANAADGDQSQAEARFLGGSLLVGSLSLDDVVELASALATNSGNPTPVIDAENLNLSVLQMLGVQIPGGITLDALPDLVELGASAEYAEADDAGVSRAATGAVSDSGVVDLNGSSDYPSTAKLHLSGVLGSAITSTIADLNVELGAVSAEAALNADGPSLTRSYHIADGRLTLTVPAIGGLVGTLVGTGGIASTVDDALAALAGPDGALATVLSGLDAALSGLLTGDALSVVVTSDISGALNDVLDTPVGDGVITMDLRTGTISVDLNALLTAASPHHGLNELQPGQEILSAAVLTELSSRIAAVLATIPDLVETALTDALHAAALTITADTRIGGLGTGIVVDVSGSIGDLLDGTATASISIYALGVDVVTIPAGTIVGALVSPLTTALFGSSGVIDSAVPLVSDLVGDVVTALAPALELLNGVVSLRGNVQETSGDRYSETALRLSVGDLLGDGGIATVDLARATVGANALAITEPTTTPTATPTDTATSTPTDTATSTPTDTATSTPSDTATTTPTASGTATVVVPVATSDPPATPTSTASLTPGEPDDPGGLAYTGTGLPIAQMLGLAVLVAFLGCALLLFARQDSPAHPAALRWYRPRRVLH